MVTLLMLYGPSSSMRHHANSVILSQEIAQVLISLSTASSDFS